MKASAVHQTNKHTEAEEQYQNNAGDDSFASDKNASRVSYDESDKWMDNWMMVPENDTDKPCPEGLEYFLPLNQLVVKQRVELLEAVTGVETSNVYDVQNILGQHVFKVKENSSWFDRMCCGNKREFEMEIYDTNDKEVMHY